MNKNEKAYFKVVGMHCSSCKPALEKQLKEEEGIKKININYVTDSVIIEFDPKIVNWQTINVKLNKSGYKFIRLAR